MVRPIARVFVLVIVFSAAAFAQQNRRALTTADYDRAVRMLAPALNGLVVGGTANVTWMADGRFTCVRTTSARTENVVVDPLKRTREVVAAPPAGGQADPAGAGRGGVRVVERARRTRRHHHHQDLRTQRHRHDWSTASLDVA